MSQQLTCPHCRAVLTIADAAPDLDMCPRCLKPIPRTPLPGEPNVLSYGHAGRPRGQRAAASLALFSVGFLFGIGVCVGGYFIMMASDSAPRNQKIFLLYVIAGLIVGAGILSGIAKRKFRWSGFFPGAIVGLTLGGLALAPIAACWAHL